MELKGSEVTEEAEEMSPWIDIDDLPMGNDAAESW